MYFEPITIKAVPQRALDNTPDSDWWSQFELSSVKKHSGQISCLSISPRSPYNVLVTSFDKVYLYGQGSQTLLYSKSIFKNGINSCRCRSDGKLIVAGGNYPVIRLWCPRTNSRMVREYTGHTNPVHQTWFLPNKVDLFSCSDDMTSRIWDIATKDCKVVLNGHTDYIRAGAPHPTDNNLVVTGSYDKSVRLWDLRQDGDKCVMLLAYLAAEVYAVAWHPSGNFLATGTGNQLDVWDCIAGRSLYCQSKTNIRPTFQSCNHQKQISCLFYNNDGSRLLSGGLDGYVKVYDTTSHAVVYTFTYTSPVTSLAMDNANRTLVVGTLDGSVNFSNRPYVPKQNATAKAYYKKAGYLFPLAPPKDWYKPVLHAPAEYDMTVVTVQKQHLKKVEHKLRRFNYHAALDTVIGNYFLDSKKKEEEKLSVVSLFEELRRRNGLRIALRGRTDDQVLPVLEFLRHLILDPRFHFQAVIVLEIILEIYAGVILESELTSRVIHSIIRKIRVQVSYLQELSVVDGMLDALLVANDTVPKYKQHQEEKVEDLSILDD